MNNKQKEDIGVSIIVPCYNAGEFIDETINSILEQDTKIPYEIIIVEDGSNDLKTLERVSFYEKLDNEHINVVRHELNKGLSATRNTGINMAKYPYILPLDADDKLVTPDKLNGQLGYIEQGARRLFENPNIDVVTPQAYMFGNVSGSMRYPRFDEKKILFKNHIPTFSMVRKSVIDEVGGYSEGMDFAEDWDLWVAKSLLHKTLPFGETLSASAKNTDDDKYDSLNL